ncbi:MAG TPA: hypothetical protein ENJ51_10135 [Leucothrix mucor]|uniref:Uncharacterized protein n=1 Tax=Leucothrix mucor TaxID=45248 RepID=A0A7V2WVJ0_LEUMU|nr:hypothetical protein [Leucothrix mucor]
MTKPITNNITTAGNTTKTPIKVALVGLTMIQQAILEFYFATQEGSQKFTEVLGKDAEAYITNFDEQGAIDAWDNLYADNNKPTLVLSNYRKDDGNYFYFPRPVTPDGLLEAAELMNELLENNNPNAVQTLDEPSVAEVNTHHNFNEFISENEVIDDTKPDGLKLFDSVLNEELNTIEGSIDTEVEMLSPDTIPDELTVETEVEELNALDGLILDTESGELEGGEKPDESISFVAEALSRDTISGETTSLEELSVETEAKELNALEELISDTESDELVVEEKLSESIPPVEEALSPDTIPDGLASLEELIAETEVKELNALDELLLDTDNDELVVEEKPDESVSLVDFSPDSAQIDSLLEDKELSFDKVVNESLTSNIADKTNHQESIDIENMDVLFNDSFLDNQLSLPTEEENEEDKFTSPEELQSFLDELSEKNAKQALENEKTVKPYNKKSAEQLRWIQLCGQYEDASYEKNAGTNTRFKLEATLLPYVVDTVSFTERAECWMELSYNPLSIIINPEKKLVYSNLSIEDPVFVQICSGNMVEELIEYLEVDADRIEKINNGSLENKLFSYDLRHFIWTISLLVSHGRLPEDCNPDEKIRIINWLSLNKVEKFPYIMQIAAVFNQHYASLNEAAAWMTLPKRYVYAFYNGVLALDMIDKNPKKSSKQKLIARGDKENNESGIKNILFKKII